MGTDAILRELSKYIFIGIVSQYGKTLGTVIVTRPDQDDRTSAELYVISRCTKDTKDYWMPDIGEAVMCILLPNASGKGPGEGFVIGAHYSEVDAPAETDTSVRSIRYKDGSYIVNNNGAIEIHASKSLKLTAPRIELN
ncbi:MAG: phage baseplate assembly protein V [Schwartzia sp.]|nr:phage baseplate assembly protein V [Schwartzia sp. (in: firmicutes)]